jgi:hypothetical protein
MNDIPKVVFSRTLRDASWPETRIARGDTALEIGRVVVGSFDRARTGPVAARRDDLGQDRASVRQVRLRGRDATEPTRGDLAAVASGKASLPNGVIVVDTQVAGRWKRTVRADTVVLDTVRCRPFDAAETAALHAAADKLGMFLGARAVVAASVL